MTQPLPTLVLGTHNAKKGAELQRLFRAVACQVRTLADYPDSLSVAETGQTFGENAQLKAVQQARHLGEWVIGEDSGLEVTALDGAPGIHSARFSGPNATDASNNALLLDKLRAVPLADRTARYVCHICVADPDGEVRMDVEDACCGRITLQSAGTAGFGYDPLFEIVEYHRTFGQLGDGVKSVLSHRGRAMRRLLVALPRLLRHGCM